MSLTTLAKVKAELEITDSSKDTILTEYINIISAKIEEICGRTFAETSYTAEKYIGTNTTSLMLRQYPIISIEKIEVDEVEIDDYELQDLGKKIGDVYRLCLWKSNRYLNPISNNPKGSSLQAETNISVDYTAGYAEIPFDLSDIATQEVVRRYEKRYQKGTLKSWDLGNGSKTKQLDAVHGQSGFLEYNYYYLVGHYKNLTV